MKVKEILTENSHVQTIIERWSEKLHDIMANPNFEAAKKEVVAFMDKYLLSSNPPSPVVYVVRGYIDEDMTSFKVALPIIALNDIVWNQPAEDYRWRSFLQNDRVYQHRAELQFAYLIQDLLIDQKVTDFTMGDSYEECWAMGISLTSVEEAMDNYHKAMNELKDRIESYNNDY